MTAFWRALEPPVTLTCSDLFRFPLFLLLCSHLRSLCSGMPPDVFRFAPICSDFFREQIRTNQGNPLQSPRAGKVSLERSHFARVVKYFRRMKLKQNIVFTSEGSYNKIRLFNAPKFSQNTKWLDPFCRPPKFLKFSKRGRSKRGRRKPQMRAKERKCKERTRVQKSAKDRLCVNIANNQD